MAISNNKKSINEAIDRLTEEQARARHLISVIQDKYLSKNAGGWPCAALVWDLLGGDAHMTTDQSREMQATFTDLLVFLTDPEIAAKFEMIRQPSSRSFAIHLRRLLEFTQEVNTKQILAEIAHYQLSEYGCSEQQLRHPELDFLSE